MDEKEYKYGLEVHDFKKSMQKGKQAEDIFSKRLDERNLRYDSNVDSGGVHSHDFTVYFGTTPIRVEIKNDIKALSTGNLAFEVKSSNNRDGWFVDPKADVYVVFVGSDIYVMHRVDFKYIRERNCNNWGRFRVVANKNYLSLVFPVPLKELRRYKANDLDHAINIIYGMVKNHHRNKKV